MKAVLVIPAYNESLVIKQTIQSLVLIFDEVLVPRAIDWEILVVDNASSDGTADVVSSLEHPKVGTLILSEKGKGRAVRAGFSSVVADVFGFTDADLSVSPEEIASAFLRIGEGEAGIVIGSRAHPNSVLPGREWWRTVSSRIFNLASRLMIGVPFGDTQCPLKVMDQEHRDLFLSTQEDTWFFDAEFLALVHRLDRPILEVPVLWSEHRYPDRKSKLSTTRDGLRSLAAFWRIRQRTPAKVANLRKSMHNGSAMQWIIVGLGNPGGVYAKTRHNAGRIVLEAYAKTHNFPDWSFEKTHNALITRGEIAGSPATLLLPETFMNDSGKSLLHLVKFPEQIQHLVVIHDDADLPVGSWRFAYARGSGGQKGIDSIMKSIKSRDFVRVRIGIGKEGTKERAGDIVLEKLPLEELAQIERIGEGSRLHEGLSSLVVNGLEYARSQWQKWKEEHPNPPATHEELLG